MRRRAALGAVASLSLAWTAAASAQTVDDVVRRYLDARGGLSRLRAVESLRLSGSMVRGGVSTRFVIELKRPDRMRTDFSVEGRPFVRAYDGKTAWTQPPLPGEPARPMDAEEAAEARAQADVDLSPLVDAAAKGYAVELVGRDRLPGGDTWKLVVRGKGDPPRTLQLDARTHLVVQVEDRRTVDGQPVDFVTEVGDYRPVGGLVFPHRFEVGPRDSGERQRLLVEKVEVNPPLDDARFAMPTPAGPREAPRARPPSVLP